MQIYWKTQIDGEGEKAFFVNVEGVVFRIDMMVSETIESNQIAVVKYGYGNLEFNEATNRYERQKFIDYARIFEQKTYTAKLPTILGGEVVELCKGYKQIGMVSELPSLIEIVEDERTLNSLVYSLIVPIELELLPPIITKVKRKDRILFTDPNGEVQEITHIGYVGNNCLAEYKKEAEYAGSFAYTQTVWVAVPK